MKTDIELINELLNNRNFEDEVIITKDAIKVEFSVALIRGFEMILDGITTRLWWIEGEWFCIERNNEKS